MCWGRLPDSANDPILWYSQACRISVLGFGCGNASHFWDSFLKVWVTSWPLSFYWIWRKSAAMLWTFLWRRLRPLWVAREEIRPLPTATRVSKDQGPSAPVKPSDCCSPSLCSICHRMRGGKLEPPSWVTPELLTVRNCGIINICVWSY